MLIKTATEKLLKKILLIIIPLLFLSGCGIFFRAFYYDYYTYNDPFWASNNEVVFRWISDGYSRGTAINSEYKHVDRDINYYSMNEHGSSEGAVFGGGDFSNKYGHDEIADYKASLSPNAVYFAAFGRLSTGSAIVIENVDRDFVVYSWPDMIKLHQFVFYGNNVEWSPNDDKLVAVDSSNGHLWITGISGEGKAEIVTETCEAFAWGSGSKIAFVYDNNGAMGFGFVNPDGTGRQDLPFGDGVYWPYISRIDSNIIFGIKNDNFVKMDVSIPSFPTYTTLITTFEGDYPRLSSDEAKVVFTRDDGIWIVDIDGNNLERLQENRKYYND